MLVGKRIRLRAIEEGDLPLMASWKSAPETYGFFYEFLPLSLRMQREWFERQLKNPREINLIVALPDSTAIGMVSFVNIDQRSRKAEYGRFLIGDQGKNQGFGVDVEILCLRYAFLHMNLNKVYCEVFTTNTEAVKLHTGLGFKEEGLLKNHIFKDGDYRDVVVLAMFREDFDRESEKGLLGKLTRSFI